MDSLSSIDEFDVATEDENPVNPVNQAMLDAGNSLPAAMLLMRIRYWARRAGIERHGKVWIAKSRSMWMKETGMSTKQVICALKILTDLGLIETHQYPWGGKNILHLRLLKEEHKCKKGVVKRPSVCTPQGSMDGTLEGSPIYKGVSITEEEKKISLTANDAGASAFAENTGKTQENGKGVVVVSVSDLIKQGVSKHPKTLKKENVSGMEMQWKESVLEHHPGVPVNLPKSTFIKLKWFLKACPQGKALQMLDHVIREWSSFCATVKADAGIGIVPLKPSIDFASKYAAYAVSFVAKETSSPVVSYKLKAKTPTPKAEVKIISQPEPGSEKATWADIQEALKE